MSGEGELPRSVGEPAGRMTREAASQIAGEHASQVAEEPAGHRAGVPLDQPDEPFMGAISSRMPVQLRFGDTDKLGHVNNAVYASYAELGRLGFLRELGIEAATLILARLTIDFRRQVRLGDRCEIQTEVTRIGKTSFGLEQTLYANDEVAAEFEAVMVWFDYDAQRPARIPDDVRNVLAGPSRASR